MGYPWGLDFGNQNCVVAIARKGGIDVIDNEASSRKTPCMVGLGGTQRGLGEGGKSRITSNITNTVTDLKRLIGRRWAEEEIQRDMEMYPFKMKQAPDGGILIELSYQKDGGECVPTNYTPEQLLGMLFVNLKHTAEEHNKSPSKDCVISVPCFFNDAQRRAVKNAASIAGLNVLRLMNETAAAALHWGLPKTMDLPEDSAAPKHVLFYDMGHSSTQVCVVAYHKNNMTVLASAFDRSLGGRDFDMCMMKHFAVQWKDKTKLDLLSNPKAAYRLSVAVDKVKQQLSGYNSYAKLPVNVECLQEDHDFHSFIDTDEWIAMTKELCEKALDPVKAAIKDSKLNFDQIEEIEVIGSATRSPLITNAIRDFIGKEPKRTMNSEEAVSKGCALMAAMISPNFRVRDFQVRDSTPYPIHLSWGASAGGDAMEVDDGAATTSKGGVVFTQHNIFPSVKMLTFMRSHPFEIAATYANPTDLAPGMEPKIANFLVNNVVAAVDGGPSKVKVKVRIDIHGLLSVDSAQIVEEVEVEEPAKKEGDTPMTDSDKTPEAPSDADAGAQPAEPKPEEADEKKEEPKEKEKKKNLKKSDLPVVTNPWFEVPENKIKDFIQIEYEMSVQDRMIKELQEKKNDLEAYIYSMRERCGESGDLANFISQADREKFMSLMDIMENWLYEDEAEHANKSTFVAKLDELRVFGAPAVEKAKEAEERPLAVKSLQDAIAEYSAFVSSTDPIYEHIGSEDRAKVQEKVDAASQWLNQKLQEQASRSPTDALAVLSTDIKQKKVSLQYECRPIMTKPKPAPPKEEKKEEKKDEESKPAAGAAEGAEVPPPTPAEPMEEAMD